MVRLAGGIPQRWPGAPPRRRGFTAEYKLKILSEAEAVTAPGELGALLRREGLCSSNLTTWRRQPDEGALRALYRPQGRKPAHPLETENAELRRRLECTDAEFEKASRVIKVQGNVSALLGELLEPRREARREHRAVIQETAEELTPIVGTRPACRALGVSAP